MSRGDGTNSPTGNGEYWLLRAVLASAKTRQKLFDVGANQGDWCLEATKYLPPNSQVTLHAFEPCAGTRQILSARVGGKSGISIYPYALCERNGIASFYSGAAGLGTNSLSKESGAIVEEVILKTLDDFLVESQTSDVRMVKIDTEGHDCLVLEGASESLRLGRIEVLQFEYNWRWLTNRRSLKDVFELIKGKPYRLGKLRANSIDFYDAWHFELDRFFENNYVLIRNDSDLIRLGRQMTFATANVAVRASAS